MMKAFNIYLTGVGGQGIGLLSQALLRAIDHSGKRAIAVDTHGLAQRGGVVVSRIRCGDGVHSPLTMQHCSDLVLSMEIHEALRGLSTALKAGGSLVWLNVSWQPLPVRMGQAEAVTEHDVIEACSRNAIASHRVDAGKIADARMQNMALLGTVAKHRLVPDVTVDHYRKALEDLLQGTLLDTNVDLFNAYAG